MYYDCCDAPPLSAPPDDDGFGGYLVLILSFDQKTVEARLDKALAFQGASGGLPPDTFDALCERLGCASPGARSRLLTLADKATLLREYLPQLPPKDRSLYEIARRDPAAIVKVLESGSISPRSTIADVKSAFGDLASPAEKAGHRLMISLERMSGLEIEQLKLDLDGRVPPVPFTEIGAPKQAKEPACAE